MPRIGGSKLQTLLVGTGEHDGIVQGLLPAERDVSLEGVHQPRCVHLDELLLGEISIATGQGEELVGVVLDRADTAEEHDLADRGIRHGRTETLMHELSEATPGWCARREL